MKRSRKLVRSLPLKGGGRARGSDIASEGIHPQTNVH